MEPKHVQSIHGIWEQFELRVAFGVPHAQEIAIQLSTCGLTIPTGRENVCTADLLYYGPIHSAYRKDCLRSLLIVLKALKRDETWPSLRQCRSAQQVIADRFALDHSRGKSIDWSLLHSWLRYLFQSIDSLDESTRVPTMQRAA